MLDVLDWRCVGSGIATGYPRTQGNNFVLLNLTLLFLCFFSKHLEMIFKISLLEGITDEFMLNFRFSAKVIVSFWIFLYIHCIIPLSLEVSVLRSG